MTASFDGTNFLSTRLRTFGKQDFVPSYETPNGIRVEASIMLPQGGCHFQAFRDNSQECSLPRSA